MFIVKNRQGKAESIVIEDLQEAKEFACECGFWCAVHDAVTDECIWTVEQAEFSRFYTGD